MNDFNGLFSQFEKHIILEKNDIEITFKKQKYIFNINDTFLNVDEKYPYYYISNKKVKINNKYYKILFDIIYNKFKIYDNKIKVLSSYIIIKYHNLIIKVDNNQYKVNVNSLFTNREFNHHNYYMSEQKIKINNEFYNLIYDNENNIFYNIVLK